MISKKIMIEVEVTYDPECDMGYLYLLPKDRWEPLTDRDGAIPVNDEVTNQTHLVVDFRQERLVGIEFFGKKRFPLNIHEKLFSEGPEFRYTPVLPTNEEDDRIVEEFLSKHGKKNK
jgi:uncharacterized protein YuzE